MRKLPLVFAIGLALGSQVAFSSETFDQAVLDFNELGLDEKDIPGFDKAQTNDRRKAVTGYLHQEAELDEIRSILRSHEKNKAKRESDELSFPFEPDEVTRYRKKLEEVKQAQNEPIVDTEFKIRNIRYEPESNKPLLISLSGGFSAQIEFYDASGKPWPIRKEGIIGDGDAFTKRVMGEDRHIASFVLTESYRETNAAVVLEGLPSTIPILLKGTRSTVDGRVTVTIPKLGPKANVMPVFQHELENVSDELVSLQGGNKPKDSVPLRVSGVPNSEAWYDGESLFLSLPGRLLLPLAVNSSVSPTGKYLYKLDPTPYITVSVNGERKLGVIENIFEVQIKREPTVFEKALKR